MEEQNGKYFTLWYGVFNLQTRELKYAAGGHPPAIAVTPEGSAIQLGPTGMMIGAFSFAAYSDATVMLAPGSKLFVYSDGCYEVENSDKVMMTINQFSEILAASAPRPDALDHTVTAVRDWQERPDFEDDFSLLQFHL